MAVSTSTESSALAQAGLKHSTVDYLDVTIIWTVICWTLLLYGGHYYLLLSEPQTLNYLVKGHTQ